MKLWINNNSKEQSVAAANKLRSKLLDAGLTLDRRDPQLEIGRAHV